MKQKRTEIDLPSCPLPVRRKLLSYVAGLQDALADNIVGIYLHGSLARGCYHPPSSDMDIVVVLGGALEDRTAQEILRIQEKAGLPIDAVFVRERSLGEEAFAAHVELLVKVVPPAVKVVRPAGSRDCPLQRQDVHEAGVALFGPPPRELFQPVGWLLLESALDYVFPNIVPRFKNPVLMLCRIVHAHHERRPSSKAEAGIGPCGRSSRSGATQSQGHWKTMRAASANRARRRRS